MTLERRLIRGLPKIQTRLVAGRNYRCLALNPSIAFASRQCAFATLTSPQEHLSCKFIRRILAFADIGQDGCIAGTNRAGAPPRPDGAPEDGTAAGAGEIA